MEWEHTTQTRDQQLVLDVLWDCYVMFPHWKHQILVLLVTIALSIPRPRRIRRWHALKAPTALSETSESRMIVSLVVWGLTAKEMGHKTWLDLVMRELTAQ